MLDLGLVTGRCQILPLSGAKKNRQDRQSSTVRQDDEMTHIRFIEIDWRCARTLPELVSEGRCVVSDAV